MILSRLAWKRFTKSKEVVEKEIAGYHVLSTLLNAYTQAFERQREGTTRHFDQLVIRNSSIDIPENASTYEFLLEICNYISRLTDGNALLAISKINGKI